MQQSKSFVSRRELLAMTGGAAGMLLPGVAQAASGKEFSKTRYKSAVVIDALGDVGGYNADGSYEYPRGEAMLEASRLSGLTAINCNAAEVGDGPGRLDTANLMIDDLDALMARYPDRFMPILTGKDFGAAKAKGKIGIIKGFQDTTAIGSSLDNVDHFVRRGVRIIQLTYNLRNHAGDGSLQPDDRGLSPFGRELIGRIEREKALVDLSHGSVKTIRQAIAAASRPLSITHTGCRSLVDIPRNVWDQDLRSLADKGGVAGIYLMPFLRERGQPTPEDVMRHIEHAINVCGEDHVGIGTDGAQGQVHVTPRYTADHRAFVEDRLAKKIAAPGEAVDVFNFVQAYNSPRRFKLIADDLARRGHKDARIEKIIGGNFARLFGDVWPG